MSLFRKNIASLLFHAISVACIVFFIRTFLFSIYQVPQHSGSMETTMLIGDRFFADKISYWFRAPRRGEIVAFSEPRQEFNYSLFLPKRLLQRYVWGPTNWTKRIIGIPGDRITGLVEDNKPVLYVNGVRLYEPYLNQYPLVASKSYDPQCSFENQPFYTFNTEEIHNGIDALSLLYPGNNSIDTLNCAGSDIFDIVLSDNHYWVMGDNRLDSRDCRFFGPIDGDLIHSHIIVRMWSIDSDESWWIIDLLKHPISFWSKVRWKRFFTLI